MVLNSVDSDSDSRGDGRIFDPASFDNSTPVLLLGGQANALSLARSYGRRGITVRVSASADSDAARSRYCKQSYLIPNGAAAEDYWADLLLSGKHRELEGHALIYCNDAAIEFVAHNRAALEQRYLLDDSQPTLQLDLLDKLETLKLARRAGVGTPNYWLMERESDFEKLRQEMQWPVIIKPLFSHEFQAAFGTKFFLIDQDFDELVRRVRQCWEARQPIMIVEQIPGPDTLLSSYYTYIDREGRWYFDYTKRVIRRFPMNKGGGTYHESAWLPETAEVGRRFFAGNRLHGLRQCGVQAGPSRQRVQDHRVQRSFHGGPGTGGTLERATRPHLLLPADQPARANFLVLSGGHAVLVSGQGLQGFPRDAREGADHVPRMDQKCLPRSTMPRPCMTGVTHGRPSLAQGISSKRASARNSSSANGPSKA